MSDWQTQQVRIAEITIGATRAASHLPNRVLALLAMPTRLHARSSVGMRHFSTCGRPGGVSPPGSGRVIARSSLAQPLICGAFSLPANVDAGDNFR